MTEGAWRRITPLMASAVRTKSRSVALVGPSQGFVGTQTSIFEQCVYTVPFQERVNS